MYCDFQILIFHKNILLELFPGTGSYLEQIWNQHWYHIRRKKIQTSKLWKKEDYLTVIDL